MEKNVVMLDTETYDRLKRSEIDMQKLNDDLANQLQSSGTRFLKMHNLMLAYVKHIGGSTENFVEFLSNKGIKTQINPVPGTNDMVWIEVLNREKS